MLLRIDGVISFYTEKMGLNSLSRRYYGYCKYIFTTNNYSLNKKLISKIDKNGNI